MTRIACVLLAALALFVAPTGCDPGGGARTSRGRDAGGGPTTDSGVGPLVDAFRPRFPDADGDGISDDDEIGPDPTMPRDVDHDGTPDYLDLDSDDDTISDHDESTAETDGDGTPDRYDQDSDNDGIPDSTEAGDTDPSTPPVDTDGDHVPDFRDTDSDDDGLADSAELSAGSDPTRADSDGDGVSDLVEVASGTNANDAADSPRTRGNFVFVEPYQMPPDPPRDTLDFATDIRSADVYFLIDTTGSMRDSIASVQQSLSRVGSGIIDQIRAMIPDTNFGVGDFKDFGDAYVYRHVTDISSAPVDSQGGVNLLTASGGGDTPEGDVPALYRMATGAGRTGCPAGTFGYACFRDGSVPIVVLITDAPFHNGSVALAGRPAPVGDGCSAGHCPYAGYETYETMLPALTAHHIRVIGVSVTTYGDVAGGDLEQLARDTGALDGSGAPLVSRTAGGAVGATTIDAVRTLSMSTRFDISTRYEDNTADAVDTRAAFVDHIEANTAGDAMRGCAPRMAIDTDGDGHLDTFPDVQSGQRVCFDIIVRQNDTVMPTAMPQLFDAAIRVIGDGFTVFDSRTVYFLVPPVVPPAGPS